MRLLLVLVIVGSLLSGCTTGSDGPTLATARQAQGPADRAAESWADDATLVGASAFELDDAARKETGDELDEGRDAVRKAHDEGDLPDDEYEEAMDLFRVFDRVVSVNDDAPGDGRAAVWFFTYVSAAAPDTQYGVAVAKGSAVYTKEDGEAADEFDLEDATEAIGDWSVDSDDAADAAALGNADYPRLCASANVVAYSALAQGKNGPVWYIGAELQDSEGEEVDEVFLAVDAVTGSLVQDEVIEVIQSLYQESGVLDGTFTGTVAETQRGTFEVVDDRHLQYAVDVIVQPPPVQPMTVTITDPLGVATKITVERGQAPFVALGEALVDGAPVGTYDVALEMPVAVRHDWQVSWCTDGAPGDQDDLDNRACRAFEGTSSGNAPVRAGLAGETLSGLDRWLGAWDF
ncbi:MAG: hypothetical protein AABY18_07660 [Candidatus Thermoplasmatota archaeon]